MRVVLTSQGYSKKKTDYNVKLNIKKIVYSRVLCHKSHMISIIKINSLYENLIQFYKIFHFFWYPRGYHTIMI